MALLRYMHETLVLACAEALRGSGQGFGNLMAQTDYLCKRAGIGIADRIAIQTMRRHSNGSDSVITSQELRYDVRVTMCEPWHYSSLPFSTRTFLMNW